MNRLATANAFASAVAFSQGLHAEAEAEVEQLRAALAQRDATLAAQQGELADYEKTVTKLRAALHEEQVRRASYQGVDAVVRRLARKYEGTAERANGMVRLDIHEADIADVQRALGG